MSSELTPTPGSLYRFEWDSNKERTNVLKHDGVTFRLASTVLHDPLAITVYDDAHSDFEDRWVTLGQAVNGQTLVVVHTFLQIDANHIEVRVISARKANKQERQDYEQALQ
jgi:uncharacterized DUF497 family protein